MKRTSIPDHPHWAASLKFRLALLSLPLLALGIVSPQPSSTFGVGAAIAQTTPAPEPSSATTSPAAPSPQPLNKAKNLARQAAERTNGGLTQYRAEASMHGNSADSPFVDNGNGSWTFTFVGGPPGSTAPTVESVVTVFANDWRVVVDYNGPIRDRATASPATP